MLLWARLEKIIFRQVIVKEEDFCDSQRIVQLGNCLYCGAIQDDSIIAIR